MFSPKLRPKLQEQSNGKTCSLVILEQNTSEFLRQYLDEAALMGLRPSEFYAPLTYDAVWSMALALNASVASLADGETLDSFSYERQDMTETFMEQMYDLHFEGMTVSPHEEVCDKENTGKLVVKRHAACSCTEVVFTRTPSLRFSS